MDDVVKHIAVLVGLIMLAGIFINYASLQTVRATVFSANGWAKKLEFNVPSPGYYEFNVPVLPGMRKGGYDVVLTDKNGNVLEYYAWSGYLIPYSEVYEVNYSIDSPVFKYVPFEFTGTGGMGVYDENYEPILFLRTSSGVIPFFGLNTYYIGVSGTESPYGLEVGASEVDYDRLEDEFYFVSNPYTKVGSVGEEFKYDFVPVGDYVYFFDVKATFGTDPWTLYMCDIGLNNCSGIASGSYFPAAPYAFPMNGRYYVVTIGNPIEISWYCEATQREDPNNFGCYNGVRLGYFDQSGDFHPVWWFNLWDPQYLWFYGLVVPYKGKFYIYTNVDNFYGPDRDWHDRPFFYLASVDPETGTVYVQKKYYFDQFVDVEEPYPDDIPINESLVPSDNGLYFFIRYKSASGVWKKVVLVFDPDTLEFKYVANAQFVPSDSVVFVRNKSGGYTPRLMVYPITNFDGGYSLVVNPDTGETILLGLRDDKTFTPNPTLVPVPFGDKYVVFYGSDSIVTDYWADNNYAYGYITPDGDFVDVLTGVGCCKRTFLYPYVDESAGKIYVYAGRVYAISVIIADSSNLSRFNSTLYQTSVSSRLLPVPSEDQIHVRAYFPAPGTYYLYYDSDSSWYHLFPQAADYASASFIFSDPMDVSIRPHSYGISVAGNGREYTVYVEFNDGAGPVYSQCFWNGIEMDQVFPGHHSLTVLGSSPVEYNLDCFALEVAELHMSSVLFFREENDLSASLTVSPSVVQRGSMVTLTYTGNNPVCYVLQGDRYLRVSYPEFNADFSVGEYNVVCDSPGYEPAWAVLNVGEEVQRPPSVSFSGGGAPSRPRVTGTVERPSQPVVQPASPLPVGGMALAGIVILIVLAYLSSRR